MVQSHSVSSHQRRLIKRLVGFFFLFVRILRLEIKMVEMGSSQMWETSHPSWKESTVESWISVNGPQLQC